MIIKKKFDLNFLIYLNFQKNIDHFNFYLITLLKEENIKISLIWVWFIRIMIKFVELMKKLIRIKLMFDSFSFSLWIKELFFKFVELILHLKSSFEKWIIFEFEIVERLLGLRLIDELFGLEVWKISLLIKSWGLYAS